MSKSQVLYVKGMSTSDLDEEEDEVDIWDDKKLNDAYDKALRIANIEVAKRLAMSTNSQSGEKSTPVNVKTKKTSSAKSPVKNNTVKWKPGMPCRAVYEQDGMDYEAFLLRIINDDECVVRFLGYDNSEIVPISTLKATLGNDERTRQIQEALQDADDASDDGVPNIAKMECGNEHSGLNAGADNLYSKKKKSSKKKKQKKISLSSLELPDMPPPMPNLSMFRNLGSLDMPMPPPPPLPVTSSEDSEDQAVSSMLLSWYMSGYYTGLYQGMKRAKSRSKQ